ncbi:MAG: NAD(P)-dependent oxidoreductase [Turicibacter sp.]|nr:NAD(P)-dependent oxidoreductase [Turicibacter sp.]
MKIGFIGIGVMGESMAGHFKKAGHDIYIYNRTKSKAEALIEAGAHWCENVSLVAKNAELIFTIIGMPADVEAVYLGDGGLVESADSGTVLVDMTTSSPDLAKKIHEAGKSKGIQVMDAPVTGGDVGAKNATLTIFVGGDKTVYQEILPILELMGKTIVHTGGPGTGQHAKMANQISIAGAIMGMSESLAYAKSAGLDLEVMLKAIGSGSGNSWQFSNMGPRIVKGDYEPGFYIKHFMKDMRIALSEAKDMGIELPGLDLVLNLYQEANIPNLEEMGTQALYKVYEAK